MAWQRHARIVVAAIGIVTVAGVYLTLGERRQSAHRLSGSRLPPKVVAQSTNAQIEHVKGLESQYRVHVDTLTSYEDESSRGTNVTIEAPNRDGRHFVVTAGLSYATKGNADMQLEKSIDLREDDGFGLKTERATFNQESGVAQADGDVTFSKGRMTGNGLGVTYNEHADLLVIRDRAHVEMAAVANQPAITFNGKTATLDRVAHLLTVQGDVHVTHGTQIITTSSAVAHLTEGDDRVTFVELRSGARVEGGLGNVASMTARDMDLTYAEDGQTIQHATLRGQGSITMTAAAGKTGRQMDGEILEIALRPDQTLDHLTGSNGVAMTIPPVDGAPARSVKGQTIDAKTAANGDLTSARFDGNVEFSEANGEGGTRTAKSGVLDLKMQDEAISRAVFTDHATFTDGDLTATAREAAYEPSAGKLHLRQSDERGRPTVADARVSIVATEIDIELEGRKISGTTQVVSMLVPSSANGRPGKSGTGDTRLPGLLQQDHPVEIRANSIEYDGDTGQAVYTGSAFLFQDDTVIRAESIRIDQKAGDLTARGGVRSSIAMDMAAPTKGDAIELRYVDQTRTVTYDSPRGPAGSPAVPLSHVQGPQGDLRARNVKIVLEEGSSKLETLEATDDVVSRVDTRTVRGRHLAYTARTESYLVKGAPVTMQQASKGGCQEVAGQTLTFNKSTDTMELDGQTVSWTRSKKIPSCQ